jgi:hypothetical protein
MKKLIKSTLENSELVYTASKIIDSDSFNKMLIELTEQLTEVIKNKQ